MKTLLQKYLPLKLPKNSMQEAAKGVQLPLLSARVVRRRLIAQSSSVNEQQVPILNERWKHLHNKFNMSSETKDVLEMSKRRLSGEKYHFIFY